MTSFWITAISLCIGILLFLLPPLLRRGTGMPLTLAEDNASLYRQQFAELDADLANGVLAPEQYEQSRNELERRVLAEGAGKKSAPLKRRANWPLAIALTASLPAAAAGLYFKLGEPKAFDTPYPQMELAAATPAAPAAAPATPPSGSVEELLPPMTERLVERLTKETPNDGNGWVLLGRSYIALGRFKEASAAFEKAVTLVPDDASLLADYAGTLSMSSESRMRGKPTQLIERALKIDPDSQKALYLGGVAAFDEKKYSIAIGHWERMLALMPPEAGRKRTIIEANVAEAKALLNGDTPDAQSKTSDAANGVSAQKPAAASAELTGSVTLSPELAAKAGPSDTVFVYARAAEGPPMPLAIINRKVKDLPLTFAMNDAMAMMPNMKLSNFNQVRVIARISKSGNAMPQSGDLHGTTPVVANDADNLKIVIDQVMP